MPKAAQEHCQEEVEVGARAPSAVSAQWDVKVITQPRGEGDVPALPELGEVGGEVWIVEILRQPKAQGGGAANSHIGVAREIAVNLYGVGDGRENDWHARIKAGDWVNSFNEHP